MYVDLGTTAKIQSKTNTFDEGTNQEIYLNSTLKKS